MRITFFFCKNDNSINCIRKKPVWRDLFVCYFPRYNFFIVNCFSSSNLYHIHLLFLNTVHVIF